MFSNRLALNLPHVVYFRRTLRAYDTYAYDLEGTVAGAGTAACPVFRMPM